MKKWTVVISRSQELEFVVNAKNGSDAEDLAHPLARNTQWSGFEAQYETSSVEEVKERPPNQTRGHPGNPTMQESI